MLKKIRDDLAQQIGNNVLPPYVYTYPPKGAYQYFTDEQQALSSWRNVTGLLNLYIHIPFCFMNILITGKG